MAVYGHAAFTAPGDFGATGTADAGGAMASRLAQVTATAALTLAATMRARRRSRLRAAAPGPVRTITVLPSEFRVDVLLVMGLTSPAVAARKGANHR